MQETNKRFFDRYDGILYEINKTAKVAPVELFIYTPDELQALAHRKFISQALKQGQVIYESAKKSI